MDPNVDEHSVMTYLSQFPKSKLKPGAPLRAKTLHPKRAKAFGPGEEPDLETVTAPTSSPPVVKRLPEGFLRAPLSALHFCHIIHYSHISL